LAFTVEGRIAGGFIAASGDTVEHVDEIRKEETFFAPYRGLTWATAAQRAPSVLDGVSGATLTSLAVREAIALRLSGTRPNLRFTDAVSLEEARAMFPATAQLRDSPRRVQVLEALDSGGDVLGMLLRTGHLADDFRGYRGPSEALVAVSADGETLLSVRLRSSYDNPEYVGDVEIDDRFFEGFENRDVEELVVHESAYDAGMEGVSGATMTSLAMADAVIEALREFGEGERDHGGSPIRIRARDHGLLVVCALALLITFTPLHGKILLRRFYLAAIVLYVGFVSGDMLAQALLLGWVRHGIALNIAFGLAVLAAVAFLAPIASGRQVYCHNICPHGAAQQLLLRVARRNRLWVPWRLGRALRLLPALQLLGVVLVGMLGLGFDLAAIEPFDAYLWRSAGLATIVIAVGGLAASAFVPMAYCRYGCPTGELLDFVRYRRGAEKIGAREMAGIFFVLVAVAIRIWQQMSGT
ncbi:MAG: FMN-binding protein, partial [Verrucomicrobiales bacterium]